MKHSVMIHEHDGPDGDVFDAVLLGTVLEVPGACCPNRKSSPLKVQGYEGCRVDKHGGRVVYISVYCCSCKRHVGTSKTELPTIFGAKEDGAIFDGRGRVYGSDRLASNAHGSAALSQHIKEIKSSR